MAAKASRSEPVTAELLDAARAGDGEAIDGLFSLAYDELREVAKRVRRRGRSETLDTTALLHETYIKLSAGHPLPATDRAHFLAIVVRAMRQVLTDAARRRLTAKRGGDALVMTYDDHGTEIALMPEEYLAIEQALAQLEAVEPRRVRVVECRFIGGLSVEETADALRISPATVKRDWRVARAWLATALRP
jgi:RNA polymerase sigma-70 factor, ECF subfamily